MTNAVAVIVECDILEDIRALVIAAYYKDTPMLKPMDVFVNKHMSDIIKYTLDNVSSIQRNNIVDEIGDRILDMMEFIKQFVDMFNVTGVHVMYDNTIIFEVS